MSSSQSMHAFLRSRRSIRRFRSEPLSVSVVERILATAIMAPSAHNRQPWRFAIVMDDASKSLLAEELARHFRADLESDGLPRDQVDARVTKSRARIASAPALIVLCMDASDMDRYPDIPRAAAERTMAIQSTANAGLMLLLAVHAEGLGGVWNCAPLFASAAVREVLGLPENWEPQALLMFGRPADLPGTPERRPLDEVALYV